MSCQAAKRALPVLLCLISTCDCFLSSHGLMRAVFRAPSCGRRSHLAPIRGLRAQAAGEEWELTNEQCDLLQQQAALAITHVQAQHQAHLADAQTARLAVEAELRTAQLDGAALVCKKSPAGDRYAEAVRTKTVAEARAHNVG